MDQDVRPSPISGQWYPDDPDLLAKEVDGYISNAINPPLNGDPVAVITPHAGYVYSGHVAGHAFAAIKHKHPELVVVISPMHQPYRQRFLTTGHEYYWTPLGNIPVDVNSIKELSTILRNEYQIDLSPVRNDQEHSLEIELPFLQRIYQEPFQLLPIMVRDLSIQSCESLGKGLFDVIVKQNAVVVISTDLSHFYTKKEASGFDANFLEKIQNLDTRGVFQSEMEGTGFACGAGAVIAGIHYATLAGANKGIILSYGTSGEITGDNSSVVGYGAAALVKGT